jgi:hypothetical protein
MIQVFARIREYKARRGVAALLLAVCLNLALVPCTMALEVVEEGHDCCPPELKLEPAECCQLDEATLDIRSTSKLDDDDRDAIVAPASPPARSLVQPLLAVVDPPDPPDLNPDLNALFCVYLN